MDLMNKITSILGQYSNADASQVSPDVHEHFDSVAQAVPKDTLAQGISAAFSSDEKHFGLLSFCAYLSGKPVPPLLRAAD